MGSNARGLSQALSKTKNNHQTKINVAVNHGQPTLETDRQCSERISEATEGFCCSWGGHFEHSQ